MVNNPDIKYQHIKLRTKVLLNGDEIYAYSISIQNNTNYNADTINIKVIPNRQSKWTEDRITTEQDLVKIDVQISIDDGKSFKSIFYGVVDTITPYPLQNYWEIEGRDYSSLLIDNKELNRFANLTASDIAIKFANENGLKPVVTTTTTKIGAYFHNESINLSGQKSEWDILTFLAQHENFLLYVRRDELHFEPIPDEKSNYYLIKMKIEEDKEKLNKKLIGNFFDFSYTRCFTLASDLSVTIASFNPETGKAFKKVARKTRKNKPSSKVQNYAFNISGLTPEQALKEAQRKLHEMSRQEIKVHFQLFFDNILDINHVMKITGSNMNLDQIYYINDIKRDIIIGNNGDCNVDMYVECKNHNVDSQVEIL